MWPDSWTFDWSHDLFRSIVWPVWANEMGSGEWIRRFLENYQTTQMTEVNIMVWWYNTAQEDQKVDFSFKQGPKCNEMTPAEFISSVNFNQRPCMITLQSPAYCVMHACSIWPWVCWWNQLRSKRRSTESRALCDDGEACRSKLAPLRVWMHFGAIKEAQPYKCINTETSRNSEDQLMRGDGWRSQIRTAE